MQRIQYNAPNCMYVFQNCSVGEIPEPPFGAVTQNRTPSPPKSWRRTCHNMMCLRSIILRRLLIKICVQATN